MPLNGELTALGGCFVRATTTTADYRLYALPGGPPLRPGLLRADGGGKIAVEVWSLPPEGFGRFVAGIPAPLGVGTLALADGTRVKGSSARPSPRKAPGTSLISAAGAPSSRLNRLRAPRRSC